MPKPQDTMKSILTILFTSLFFLTLTCCIEDGFTTSVSDRPEFSTDTLDMGIVLTSEQSATHRFIVYNRHNKSLNLDRVTLSGADAGYFRANIDGMAGSNFSDIEIRANDSIFVFVCADLPENGIYGTSEILASLDFEVNGRVSSVTIKADGQDVERLTGCVIDKDTEFTADRPYKIMDSLVVAEDATLTLAAGSRLLFHDKSAFIVKGTLRSEGIPLNPVTITGDRMGSVISGVSFDLMSRQWDGIEFYSSSHDNYMANTEVSNTSYGVTVYGDGQDTAPRKLTLVNCRLRNSGGNVLTAIGASVDAYGCEFAECSDNLVQLIGGDHRFDLCTTSNHYLFSAISGAAWSFPEVTDYEETQDMEPTKALITNSIIFGLGADVQPGDLSGREIYFRRCLIKSEGDDDDNFTDTMWGADPLFYTVRADYLFDYRIKPESPAIGAAFPEYSDKSPSVDYYGEPRTSDLGAYVFVDRGM